MPSLRNSLTPIHNNTWLSALKWYKRQGSLLSIIQIMLVMYCSIIFWWCCYKQILHMTEEEGREPTRTNIAAKSDKDQCTIRIEAGGGRACIDCPGKALGRQHIVTIGRCLLPVGSGHSLWSFATWSLGFLKVKIHSYCIFLLRYEQNCIVISDFSKLVNQSATKWCETTMVFIGFHVVENLYS